jgi:hypothetical protein
MLGNKDPASWSLAADGESISKFDPGDYRDDYEVAVKNLSMPDIFL